MYPPGKELMRKAEILGYESLGKAGVKGRHYLRPRGEDSFNLDIEQLDGAHCHCNLALRDYLRAHPTEQAHYAALKKEAVAAGVTRLLAYSDARSGFLAELIERAMTWRSGS